ncbi:MAG TPA: hypothetical protein V6C72_01900 [Chroococcales cyanobacterium]
MFSRFGTNVRLATVIAVTLFVGFALGDQWSWHRHWLNRPWESLGWLVLVIASVLVVTGLTVKHNKASALVGAILGGLAVTWGLHVLKGISWASLGILGLIVVGFALLVGASYVVVFGKSRRVPHARLHAIFAARSSHRRSSAESSTGPAYT